MTHWFEIVDVEFDGEVYQAYMPVTLPLKKDDDRCLTCLMGLGKEDAQQAE